MRKVIKYAYIILLIVFVASCSDDGKQNSTSETTSTTSTTSNSNATNSNNTTISPGINNTSFPNGLNGWSIIKASHLAESIHLGAGVDGVGYIEMPETKDTSSGYRYAEVYKRSTLTKVSLSNTSFEFNATQVTGDVGLWPFKSMVSGIGGVFICFENNQNDIGCYVAGAHTDLNTLPIKTGMSFDISSTYSMNYEKITSGSMSRNLNLSNLVSSIPSVASNSALITSVRYGMFVAEVVGTGSSEVRRCPQCFANVNASKLTLSSY